MGHRMSKSHINSAASTLGKTHKNFPEIDDKDELQNQNIVQNVVEHPTINLRIHDSPNSSSTNPVELRNSLKNTQSSPVNQQINARQIIIKIQLAKMENGNVKTSDEEMMYNAADQNENTLVEESNEQVLKVTLDARNNSNGKSVEHTAGSSHESTLVDLNRNQQNKTNFAASSSSNSSYNTLVTEVNKLQLSSNEQFDECAIEESAAEYCEVLEQEPYEEEYHACVMQQQAATNGNNNNCSHSKIKSPTTSRRRCCKCKCLDALRGLGLLQTSTNPSSPLSKANNKMKKEQLKEPCSRTHSNRHDQRQSLLLTPTRSLGTQPQRHSMPPTMLDATNRPSTSKTAANSTTVACATSNITHPSNQVSIWAPSGSNDVIIHISAPAATTNSVVTVERINENQASTAAICLAEIVGAASASGDVNTIQTFPATVSTSTQRSIPNTFQTRPGQIIVHSQIDFVHCLVPDLERITNSSFYWGKMDRYEAERLLEGKPDGTFLLRDSAQEEFLFSVTFRKYGRSLHARIEQSMHRFSFDIHDPCVFTAPTVTGLLEHYKDPSSVMFFEPMLTIPLHRKITFSLQQLCRASIVSNTTYDGINQLELPVRLKSYLKEYHYKQRLRVKPFDEPFYGRT